MQFHAIIFSYLSIYVVENSNSAGLNKLLSTTVQACLKTD